MSPPAAPAPAAATEHAGLQSPRARKSSRTLIGDKINVPKLMSETSKLRTQVEELSTELTRLRAQAAAGDASGAPSAPSRPSTSSSSRASTSGAGEPPPDVLKAAERGDLEAVKVALALRKADKDATNRFGRTPLIEAARKGHLHVVEALLAVGADREAKNKFGQTAADFALEQGHLMTYARLDPEGARLRGAAVRRIYAEASVVHLLSARARKDASQIDRHHPDFVRMSCEPARSAENLQRWLQEQPGVKVFNPNTDNAFVLEGLVDVDGVNGMKLLNFRGADFGLERVRATGGCMLQLLVPPGLSTMQQAEADMAADKGVRVVIVDCTRIGVEAYDYHFEEMAQLQSLRDRGGADLDAAAAQNQATISRKVSYASTDDVRPAPLPRPANSIHVDANIGGSPRLDMEDYISDSGVSYNA